MESETLAIRDAADAAEAIRVANARHAPLAILGAGTKQRLGRNAPLPQKMSTRELTGVTLYEPEELVFSARAGTPLAEIEALLDVHNQQLAFEPIDYAPLFGGVTKTATIGGVIACNLSGSRRIKAGAARDHLLGFQCVTGRGDKVKSGGRVMKNVTGYDLSKLICGSYGTLALLTEVTLKVLPKPDTENTLLLSGVNENILLAQLRRASATPCEVSSYAVLPASIAPNQKALAALRLEGPENSVTTRCDDLIAHLKDDGSRFDMLYAADSLAFWQKIRDASPIAERSGDVWRISVAPTDGIHLVETLKRSTPLVAHFYDWAGGLVWLCLERAPDAYAQVLRAAVDAVGGHATLVRAGEETRARVDVFHPQPAPLAALSKRVKESFDPLHILERGRMRAEY